MSLLWFGLDTELPYAVFVINEKIFRILQSDLEVEYEGIFDQLQAEGLGLTISEMSR